VTSEPAIEISLKLATIYSKLNDNDKAESGFNYCLTNQEKLISSIDLSRDNLSKEEINSLALFGMIQDWYGKHLIQQNEYKKALLATSKALSVCEKINGHFSEQTLTLISDVGTIYLALNQPEEALKNFREALKIASTIDSPSSKTLYYNIGMCYLQANDKKLAGSHCYACLRLALKENDKDMQKMANECIKLSNET
jgi:PREDICTED: similar to tetratricopeptide repeat domain 19